MRVHTETGSIYEFRERPEWTEVRRVDHTHDMRRDGEWLRVIDSGLLCEGFPLQLALEPLGDGDVTYRTTSRVTRIE
jgi:hypothetical protein